MSGSRGGLNDFEFADTHPRFVGQLAIARDASGDFIFKHRADFARDDLASFFEAEDAAEIARFDDGGKFRPLKTAPNLRHGWKLILRDHNEARIAFEHFYPGRLAMLRALSANLLATTPFRETLARQSGMYHVAAKISEDEADRLIGDFCRSDVGCLRTILWRRDAIGTVPSSFLPPEKFDPTKESTPLLCQEACNLLVAAAREVVKRRAPAEVA